MNVQTEHLENQIARITVTIDDDRWLQAKKDSARELSKRYKIPGFRKGKAPYNIMVRYIGEAPIVEDAMERLGNEVYRDVLENAEFEPYAAGSLEDFTLDPQPVYVFTVPMQPEVDLGDYRAVRLDYEAPQVTDEDVDEEMRNIQQREAIVEESQHPVQAGDRVTIDIDSEFIDDAPETDEDNDDAEEDADDTEDAANHPAKGDAYIHQHDAEINVDPEDKGILPGFAEALIGAEADQELVFELDIPDEEDYGVVAGRKVQFNVTVKTIKNVTLPELNDDFAARVTADEDDEEAEPLTLLQLRMRTREQLQEQAEQEAESKFATDVLDAIVEQATISYPPIMLDERIHDMIGEFDQMLRQQGMDLDTYQQVTGITHEDLHEQYHDDAVASLRRSLVMTEVMIEANLQITDAEVNDAIEEILSQFGDSAEQLRGIFDTPQQRQQIANRVLTDRIMDTLVKIGKGEPLDEPTEDADGESDVQADAEADQADDVEASAATQEGVPADEEEAAGDDAVSDAGEAVSEDDEPETEQSETDD